jgi:hypothetical protein
MYRGFMRKLRLYHYTLIAEHITIILAVIFLCIGSYFIGKQILITLNTINTAGNDIHSTFEIINRPRTGTLAGLNEDIFETKGVLDHTNIILNHEQAQLTKVDEQEAILFTDLHTVAQNVNGEVTSLNTATESLNTFLKTSNQSAEKLPNLVTGLTKITNDADTQINDPNLKKTIANMAETSTQLAGTTTDLRKVSDHFESEIDNPKPKTLMQKIKVIWGVVWQVAMLAK